MPWGFSLRSLCFWGGKEKKPLSSNNPQPNSSSDLGLFLEPETVKFPLMKPQSSRTVPKRHRSRREKRVDREFDIVVVRSDGNLSGSDSDDPDWSIGWLEHHAPGFQRNVETTGSESSFAVLVPSYKHCHSDPVESSKDHILGVIDISDVSSSEHKKVEEFLTYLRNN